MQPAVIETVRFTFHDEIYVEFNRRDGLWNVLVSQPDGTWIKSWGPSVRINPSFDLANVYRRDALGIPQPEGRVQLVEGGAA